MVTKEDIIAQDSLKDLTEEQISAIETLSKNSEDERFRVATGDLYRRLDESIESHTEIKRNGAEKTYDYLPRAIDAMREGFEAKINSLISENTELKKGGDDAIKAKYESTMRELESARNEYKTLKDSFDEEKAKYAKSLNDYKIDNEIARACEGMKFKAGFNESALSTLKAQAIANIKGKNPTFEEREGEQRLVFYDGENLMLNKENQLKPYTAKELLMEEFGKLDILDKKPSVGSGGKGNPPTTKTTIAAATQTEAYDEIEKMVLEKGYEKGTMDFQAEVNKLWAECKCDALPRR